jgi:hypothetical protein
MGARWRAYHIISVVPERTGIIDWPHQPPGQVLSKVERWNFRWWGSGCCEIAGSFVYEQGRCVVSEACGEGVLFPVRGSGG